MKNHLIDGKPTYCCIALLESCFMRCKMCYKWKIDINKHLSQEPTLDQWKQFIRDLAQMCTIKPQINFAGGEPLVRHETLILIAFASSLGFDTHLATNAYLIDKEIALQIKQSGLKSISVSLDGVNRQTHDFLRGTPGSFDRVMKAIDLLHTYSEMEEIGICTVISELNLEEIVDIVKWANRDGRIHSIAFQAITQPFSTPEEKRWYENPKYQFLWPKDLGLVNSVMDELISLKTSSKLNDNFMITNHIKQFQMYKYYFKDPEYFIKTEQCNLYRQALNITPEGEAHICFYKSSLGNIKLAHIEELWESSQAEVVRNQIKQCRKNCQALVNCNFDEAESYMV